MKIADQNIENIITFAQMPIFNNFYQHFLFNHFVNISLIAYSFLANSPKNWKTNMSNGWHRDLIFCTISVKCQHSLKVGFGEYSGIDLNRILSKSDSIWF